MHYYFYPRPPRGRRPSAAVHPALAATSFLSTPSARKATPRSQPLRTCSENFYPRPPRGRRPRGVSPPHPRRRISIHALREEGDPEEPTIFCITSQFLSTPSARKATHRRPCSQALLHDFYPRPPRGRRPHRRGDGSEDLPISIHALREEGDQQKQRQNLYFLINYTTFCTNLEEP